MSRNTAEALIGALVLLAAAGFFYFSAQSIGGGSSGGQYALMAKFRSVEGLNVGADVRLSGVKVGVLKSISLDPETYQAVASLAVNDGIEIPDDSDIKVASDGLLGSAFLEITAGGSPFVLEPNGEIMLTQGAVSLVNLLMKFVSGGNNAN